MIVGGAREGNLKNVSLTIPQNKLVVFTGLSGSGKSTLAVDVIFNECQRQYLEALSMQGIRKPQVDFIRQASPAILIAQSDANKNPRSTVGTVTNIYTDLRMVYEKLGERRCPFCGESISAGDCRETTEKIGDDFYVYMDCNRCGQRMQKLTRTHFSHNTREGACSACQGLGKVMTIDEKTVIDESLSLEMGAVSFWEGQQNQYKAYQIASFFAALEHYGIPAAADMPVASFTPLQKAILYHGVECDALRSELAHIRPPKTVVGGRFEGVLTTLWRRMAEKEGEAKQLSMYFDEAPCGDCGGERLAAQSRAVTVGGARLPELAVQPLEELFAWVAALDASLPATHRQLVASYLLDLRTKTRRLVNVGLAYLSLDRQTITLSGGELQRLRLSAALDSDLTGILYIMDEPTIGLHPRDTAGMVSILHRLRDRGNTVLIIEHDPDVMREADYIVDIGPGAGRHGGEIVAAGSLEDLVRQAASVTGRWLREPQVARQHFRGGDGGEILVECARMHNLQNIDVRFPTGCLIAVTGVSGSGKSTLVFDVLARGSEKRHGEYNRARGVEAFDRVIAIEQSAIARMRRSNVATYSEAYGEIRKLFGALPEAVGKGLSARHFSFNAAGGRCERCEGLGYIESNMLFFADIEVTCPVCGGKQFSDKVLSVLYEGRSIHSILQLSVEEALTVFERHPKITKPLRLLAEVGLGYLGLGQSLTTLSGGEGQRLKLAKELIANPGKRSLYLMDEPTTGLHPVDVEHFLALLDRLVDAGNTVIVVEHNRQIVRAADWIIDMGPEGGTQGGQVMFAGTPDDFEKQATAAQAYL